MKTLVNLSSALLLCGLLAGGPPAASTESAPAAAHDAESSAAVRSVWAAIDSAFNARDAQRFSRLFAEDVSFVRVKSNEALKGRAAVYEEFARRFPNFAPDVRHSTAIHEVRAIAPNLLAADGKVAILRGRPDAGAEPPILATYAIFAVMIRKGGDWKVRMLRIYELPMATIMQKNAEPAQNEGGEQR